MYLARKVCCPIPYTKESITHLSFKDGEDGKCEHGKGEHGKGERGKPQMIRDLAEVVQRQSRKMAILRYLTFHTCE